MEDLCRYNQTGFCKFKKECTKRHEDQICQIEPQCTDKSCSKRHPKTCRNFSQKGECRHNEKCAYSHKQQENVQLKFNEIMLFLISRNQQDIVALKEEVKNMQNLVENMVDYNKNKEQNVESSKDVENKEKDTNLDQTKSNHVDVKDTEEDYGEKSNDLHVNKTQTVFKCEECQFECEKQITLNKHRNTKHTQDNSKKSERVNKAASNNDKFHCDECSYSCSTKKSLKKHMSQKHESSQKTMRIECEKCEITFEEGYDLQTHVEEKHCSCTSDTVCDQCLNYWVKKSH